MNTGRQALWAPELINESNGIACGDMMTINAYREGNQLFFSFHGSACKIATAVADYLEDTYSGKEEFIISKAVVRLRREQFLDTEAWILPFIHARRNCVESPISLLAGILDVKHTCDKSDRENEMLACDACVSTKSMNWSVNETTRDFVEWKDIWGKLKRLDSQSEMELQKLGLCKLTPKQQLIFQNRLEHITDEDFILIKKMRLASLYFNNAQKYHLKLDSSIEELSVKQVVSLSVANDEIRIIETFLKSRKLRIDAVKGGRTNQYYPEGTVRTHMDFDYLAGDFEDAFRMITYLINERNFKLVIGGSVPFSMKTVFDENKQETLTGHIHLEKILQNKYQVVIDINMGGFPLGRTGIIKCNDAGRLELEDLVCITLAHLFKHEHAFMKDINDLYYLLESGEIDQQKLMNKISSYQLTSFFIVTYRFLKQNLGLKADLQLKGNWFITNLRFDGWPYSRKLHFCLKALDLYLFNKKQFGTKRGMIETRNQIYGLEGKINSVKYKDLCATINTRTYFYPITIFKNYHKQVQAEQFTKINDVIAIYKQIMISPIGLFLIQNQRYTKADRTLLEKDIETVLQILNLDVEKCHMSYVMEARKDTWLY